MGIGVSVCYVCMGFDGVDRWEWIVDCPLCLCVFFYGDGGWILDVVPMDRVEMGLRGWNTVDFLGVARAVSLGWEVCMVTPLLDKALKNY